MWTFFRRFRRFSSKGFTLIELLIVVAVIALITTVILFNQQKFNSTTLLRSLAYSVALSARQAQVYGTAVRQASSGDDRFSASYGLAFTGDPTHYWLFEDRNNDQVFASDEQLREFRIGNGFSIQKFCAVDSSGTETCSGTTDWLTITFMRPNPDARFETSGGLNDYTSAYVQLRSPGGDTRRVTISLTGQIVVGAVGS